MQTASQLALDQYQKRWVCKLERCLNTSAGYACYAMSMKIIVLNQCHWHFYNIVFFLLSVREKEENMKTVEGLLEKGLIEVANKEEELKVSVFCGLKRDSQM